LTIDFFIDYYHAQLYVFVAYLSAINWSWFNRKACAR